MSFVQAKCPECGGTLAVDDNQKAAVCQFCGEAFIVQEAVNNYITNNITNNNIDNSVSHNYGAGAVVNIYGNQNSVETLLKRVSDFLENEEWQNAKDYCEKVLDIEPENPKAYLGKLMADLKARDRESIKYCSTSFTYNNNYRKLLRICDDELKRYLAECLVHINERNEKARVTAHLNEVYSKAKDMMRTASTADNYNEAAKLFDSIIDYKDSSSLKNECFEKAENARKESENLKKDKIFQEGVNKESNIPYGLAGISCYEKAIELYKTIPGWKDADERILNCEKKIEEILLAEKKVQTKKRTKKFISVIFVLLVLGVIVFGVFSYYPEYAFNKEDKIFVREDGTIIATGKRYASGGANDVTDWTDIKGVSDGSLHIVGLRKDKTVVAVGDNSYGQCNVAEWTDIVAVSASNYHTVGLKSDRTVVAIGDRFESELEEIHNWTGIIDISTGGSIIAGLTENKTVVAVGGNEDFQNEISNWTDIVAISAGDYYLVGLKSDGTVVSAGSDSYGECNVSDWSNIKTIYTFDDFITVGIKKDGRVVATGNITVDELDAISNWTDVAAIDIRNGTIISLKSDGTIVCAGRFIYECDDYINEDIVSVLVSY